MINSNKINKDKDLKIQIMNLPICYRKLFSSFYKDLSKVHFKKQNKVFLNVENLLSK